MFSIVVVVTVVIMVVVCYRYCCGRFKTTTSRDYTLHQPSNGFSATWIGKNITARIGTFFSHRNCKQMGDKTIKSGGVRLTIFLYNFDFRNTHHVFSYGHRSP